MCRRRLHLVLLVLALVLLLLALLLAVARMVFAHHPAVAQMTPAQAATCTRPGPR